tara:strand:+ start:772 stop:1047 length:276 start_codon:yes stop_codon:yes gene_type:complete
MKNDYKKYGNKTQKIVQNKIKLEKFKFQGKIITREVIVKEWNIPNIITTDIGYQLMFGNTPPTLIKSTKPRLDEYIVNNDIHYFRTRRAIT